MSNFNEKDYEKVQKWGNAAADEHWMAGHNKTLYPVPGRRDLAKMKEFMRMKYVQKRFLEDEDGSDESDENSSDEDKKKRKKKKKKVKAKTKKHRKHKKKVTSSENESDEDSDDNDSEEEAKQQTKFKPIKGKLKTGHKLHNKLGKPVSNKQSTKSTPAVNKTEDVMDILGMGSDSTPPPDKEVNGGGWANFESGVSNEKEQKSSEDPNDLWGAFDTPTPKEKKTTDLLSNLGDLYGEAAQTQQQVNPFGGFRQQNMGQSPQGVNNYGTQAVPNNFGIPQQPRKISTYLQLNINLFSIY